MSGAMRIFCCVFVLFKFTDSGKTGGRVIGGTEISPHKYPELVGLYGVESKKSSFWCGAIIINPTYVVTAAHCIEPRPKYFIVAGQHNRSVIGGHEQTIGVEKIIEHPKYEGGFTSTAKRGYDIALLKLNKSLQFNSFVQPTTLPSMDLANLQSGAVTAVGWGVTKTIGGKISDVPMEVTLEVIPNKECMEDFGIPMYKNFICTKADGKGMCSHDSGGPLFKMGNKEKPILVGIVSMSTQAACAPPDNTDAFTRITKFVNWIEEEISTENETKTEKPIRKGHFAFSSTLALTLCEQNSAFENTLILQKPVRKNPYSNADMMWMKWEDCEGSKCRPFKSIPS